MSYFFSSGGALKPSSLSYIKRSADQELLDSIKNNEFCYVLSTRQMGKSSLMAQTASILNQGNWLTIIIDLTRIGGQEQNTSNKNWYYGVVYQITRELNKYLKKTNKPQIDIKKWWLNKTDLSVVHSFSDFFEDILLKNIDIPVTLFFDEIDSTISLPFTDDFFAAIRACYNSRLTNKEFNRINFVLLGVATPDDLIKDTRRTPFNIGKAIQINDFTPNELIPLGKGFENSIDEAYVLINRIHYWTNGHPYLSQKLASLICNNSTESTPKHVDTIVKECFLTPKSIQIEPNFKFLENRIIKDSIHSNKMLLLYKKLLKRKVVVDDPLSSIQNGLKLSGLVKLDESNNLQIRNQLYRAVFNKQWVSLHLSKDRTIFKAVFLSIAASLIIFLFWLEYILPKTYIDTLKAGLDNKVDAYSAYNKLAKIPGYEHKANRLLADYFSKRAVKKHSGNRNRMLLTYLEGLKFNNSSSYRKQVASNLLQEDYLLKQTLLRGKGQITAVSRHWKTIATLQKKQTHEISQKGGHTNYIKVWETTTKTALSPMISIEDAITHVSLSLQGDKIAFATDNKVLQVKYVSTGKSVWLEQKIDIAMPMPAKPPPPPPGHENTITYVSFDNSGRSIATASEDKTAGIWNISTGMGVKSLEHKDKVDRILFNHNADIVATVSKKSIRHVWDVTTGKELIPKFQHSKVITDIVFNSRGDKIATASEDYTVHVWNILQCEAKEKILKHDDIVLSVVFNNQGDKIATGSNDKTARIWSSDTATLMVPPLLHEDTVTLIAFNAEGDKLATATSNNKIRIWDVSTGKRISPLLHHKGTITHLSFDLNNGKEILNSASSDGVAKSWHLNLKREYTSLVKSPNLSSGSVILNQTGSEIITIGPESVAHIWDTEIKNKVTSYVKHDDNITRITIDKEGKKIATASIDKKVKIWDITSKNQILQLEHNDSVNDVVFNAKGDRVATAGLDGFAHIWDTTTGEEIVTPIKHNNMVYRVIFNKKGDKLATITVDNYVQIWNSLTGEPLSKPLRHDNWVMDLLFLNKTDEIATLSSENIVHVWDINTGKVRLEFKHEGAINEDSINVITFNKQDNIIITSSQKYLHLWDRISGKEISPPIEHENPINYVLLSKDSSKLLTVTDYWLRWFSFEREVSGNIRLTMISARPLEANFEQGEGNLSCLDDACNGVRILLSIKSLEHPLQTLYFDSRNKEPLQGDATELFKYWAKKLMIDPNSL